MRHVHLYTALCMLATADMPRNCRHDSEQMAGKQVACNTVFGFPSKKGKEDHRGETALAL